MAVGYYFNPEAMTAGNYDEIIQRLEAAGAGNPPGRTYHVAFGEDSGLSVFDIWDSTEQFDKFGETLMPILQSLGVDPGEPSVVPVHNIIIGS
jgi:hypothetical protein